MIAFIADVHVGNSKLLGGPVEAGVNRRCRQVLDVLNRAMDAAVEKRCSDVYVLGDLFDGVRPEPQIIRAVQEILHREDGPLVTLLMGNHEQVSITAGDHALGPLVDEEHVQVIERPEVLQVVDAYNKPKYEVVAVPFRPGSAVEWLPTVVHELPLGSETKVPRLLLLHLGVWDEQTMPFLQGKDDSVPLSLVSELASRYRISAVFAGNWHSYRKWWQGKFPVVQVGALCPTGWKDPGLDGYGRVILCDPTTQLVDHVEIPGPRFIKASSVDQAERVASAFSTQGWQLYVHFEVEPDQVAGVTEWLEQAQERQLLAGGRVEAANAKPADVEQIRHLSHDSAIEEAVDTFVRQKLVLPKGLSAEEVVAVSLGYIRQAG